MYILFETVPGNDPRLEDRIQIKDNVWHYTIAKINDNIVNEVRYDWLNSVELTDGEFTGRKFFNALDGQIPVMVNVSNPSDISEPTSYGDNNYEKQIYTLTQADRANTVSLMKKLMTLHTNTHQTDDQVKDKLLRLIPNVSTLEEAQMFMATYFEWECAYTADKDKVAEFSTSWSWGDQQFERGDQDEDEFLRATGQIPEGGLPG